MNILHKSSRSIGLHLRLDSTLLDIAYQALRLEVPIFQCFLFNQVTKRHIKVPAAEKKAFLELRDKFSTTYVHGSYLINLCSANPSHRILKKELELAKQFNFTHLILHPGSHAKTETKPDGIDNLARALNQICKNEHDITIVLENSAYARTCIGGDITDFAALKQKLDYPEKVAFCIDTAHAYCYGYDLAHSSEQQEFINQLDQLLGVQSIALIHLNDTREELGIRHDCHEVVGQGNIGVDSLRNFVNDDRLKSVPILMELPALSERKMAEVVSLVKNW